MLRVRKLRHRGEVTCPLGLQVVALGFELRKSGFEDSGRFGCYKAFTLVEHINDWLAFNK